MLLYVSGPYTADTPGGIDANVAEARKVGIELWERGHVVIVPHLNTLHFEQDCKLEHADYIRGDLQIIARCDGMVMLPTWGASRGAREEHEYAQAIGVPIWYYPDVPELHITEQRCPGQCKAFAEVLGHMYRVHLKKNADYSPANCLLTGEVGLATRLWDKIARILNLTGFVFDVNVGRFEKPRAAQNESLDDAYMDAAVYAIIGMLLREGKWGR
jgi:hypothetical protein